MILRIGAEGTQMIAYFHARGSLGECALETSSDPKHFTVLCIDLCEKDFVVSAPGEMSHACILHHLWDIGVLFYLFGGYQDVAPDDLIGFDVVIQVASRLDEDAHVRP